jgi:carbonyl reductase 1
VAKRIGKVDVLINNAGTYLDASYSPENAKKTLDVNYRGTLNVCALLKCTLTWLLLVPHPRTASCTSPAVKDYRSNARSQMCKMFILLLSDHGRIVNLSSVSSTLKPYSEQVRQRFRNPDMTLEELEQLVQEFEASPPSSL